MTNSSASTLPTVALILLALSACTKQGYSGPALSDTEVATIEISNRPGLFETIQITSVNGDRLWAPFADIVTLAPGCHSLAVWVSGDFNLMFTAYDACATFPIRVEAGKTYLMREFNREYISVHDLSDNLVVGRGFLREMGSSDTCREQKEDTAALCVALDDGEAEDQ
jgi:hypothetical protein